MKKTAAKRPSKKDMKVRTFVEFYGKQVEEKEMIARVKKAWTKKGKRVGEIEDTGTICQTGRRRCLLCNQQ